jgi:hypothetical protein
VEFRRFLKGRGDAQDRAIIEHATNNVKAGG